MLDIEFIGQPPCQISGAVVYQYGSGVFRSRFIDILEKMAEWGDGILIWCDPAELILAWSAPGLLDGIRICDLDAANVSQARRLLELAAAPPSAPTVLLVCNRHRRPGRKGWGLFVEEPAVNRASMPVILQFLSRYHDLPIRTQNSKAESYFAELIDGEGGEMELRTFVTAYDVAAVLYTNEANEFEPPSYKDRVREGRSYVVRSADRFIMVPDERAEAELFRALAIKSGRGWSVSDLSDECCRAALVLLERDVGSGLASVRSAALWACLTLCFSGNASSGDSDQDISCGQFLLVMREQICLFREMTTESPSADGLNWANGGRFSREVIDAAWCAEPCGNRALLADRLRAVLMGMLAASLPSWGKTVLSDIDQGSALSISASAQFRQAASGAAYKGNEQLAAVISKRLQSAKPRPFVIVGPPGSGKLMAARFVAKALECPARVGTEACDHCASCTGFEATGGFGYIEIDLEHPNARDHIVEHVAGLSKKPMSNHRTIVLKNADAAVGAVDAFLKPFENGVSDTTFIVLASDVHNVRSAILSRSEPVVLRRVAQDEAIVLVSQNLAALGPEPQVIDLAVILGDGLRGRLLGVCELLVKAGASTVEQAKVALSLNWGSAVLDLWYAVCMGVPVQRHVAALMGLGSVQDLKSRAGKVLWCILRKDSKSEAALFGLQTEFARTCVAVHGHSDAAAQSALNADLVRLWLEEEVFGEEDVLQLLEQTSVLISRHRERIGPAFLRSMSP